MLFTCYSSWLEDQNHMVKTSCCPLLPHTLIFLSNVSYYQPSSPFLAKTPQLLRLNSPRTRATIMHQCLVFPPDPSSVPSFSLWRKLFTCRKVEHSEVHSAPGLHSTPFYQAGNKSSVVLQELIIRRWKTDNFTLFYDICKFCQRRFTRQIHFYKCVYSMTGREWCERGAQWWNVQWRAFLFSGVFIVLVHHVVVH